MDKAAATIATVSVLAGFVEWFMQRFAPKSVNGELMVFLSALLGIILCFAFNVDAIAMMGLTSPLPYVGIVVTGVIVGSGSNAVHHWINPSAPATP